MKAPPVTLDELLAILDRYHPKGIEIHEFQNRDAFDATPEIRRLRARTDAWYADQTTWLATVEELRTVMPGGTFWDRTIPGMFCYEGRVYAPDDPNRPNDLALVVLVSYLAPFYYIYGSDWLQGRGPIVTYGDDVPFPTEKARIAEIVERRFGFAHLPEEWRTVEMPGIMCSWEGSGGNTVLDLLFTGNRQ